MSSAQVQQVLPDSQPQPFQVEPAKPRGRAWLWLLLIALIVAGAGLWYRQNASSVKLGPVAKIRTAKVRVGPLERSIRITGMATAERAVTIIAPQMIGSRSRRSHSDFETILQQLIPTGSNVKKGDQLAAFDSMLMMERVDDAQAEIVQHQNYLKIMYAALAVRRTAHNQKIRAAKAAWDKAELNLKTAPVRSAIQTEKFKLDAAEAKSRHQEYLFQSKLLDDSDIAAIRVRELDLRGVQLEAKRSQNNANKMIIKAPIEGLAVVQTLRRGSENAEIQQGDQLYPGQPFMQIVDLKSLVVTGNLNQTDAEEIRVGAKAHIQVDAYPGMSLKAHVISIGAFARGSGWRRSFVTEVPVRLKFDEHDSRMIPNYSVSADIIMARKEKATLIPLECVFTEGSDNKSVAYVHKGEFWEKREIELGLQSNLEAEVLSGLEPGVELAAEKVPADRLAAAGN